MLKVIDFIKNHKNWRELLRKEPYCLKIQESEEKGWENLVLLKYNQISSDFSEEICKECRGLILEKETWRIVRFAFKKFFNLGEKYADKIDWNSAIATEKEDGSLITLYFYDNKWRIATNGNMCADWSPLNRGKYKTFGDLFWDTFNKCGVNITSLNPNYSYTMELCSLNNRIVLTYPEPVLFHILTIDNRTLEEVEMNIGIQKPRQYNLNSEKDYCDLVASMDDTHEGIVVRDKNCNRVKIKTTTYFTLHHLMNNGVMTLERAIELIWENDEEEFLVYFPELIEYFDNVKLALNSIKNAVRSITSMAEANREVLNINFSEKVAKKEFAKLVAPLPNKHIYFAAYEGTLETKISKMTAAQFIKFFNYYLEDLK